MAMARHGARPDGGVDRQALSSEERDAWRELIGWCRTLEAAASVAWDHRCAAESWRHQLAARRTDAATMAAQRPPAAELVRFYRAALRRDGKSVLSRMPEPARRP